MRGEVSEFLDLSKWNEGEAKAVREVLSREGYVY